MRNFFVDYFLVAVEGEVVALRGDVGLGHAEALRGARAREFRVRSSGFSRYAAPLGRAYVGVRNRNGLACRFING